MIYDQCSPLIYAKGDAQLLFHVPFDFYSEKLLRRSFSDSWFEPFGIAT
jgi:hypothetical protein